MTVKVTITDGDRQISVETTGTPPVAGVVADALTAWSKSRPRPGQPRRSRLQAGGMGFQAELADPEVR